MHLRRSAAAGLAALACACDRGMLVGADPTGGPDATATDAGVADSTVATADAGPDNGETSVPNGGDGSPIIFTTSFETGDFDDFGGDGGNCYKGPLGPTGISAGAYNVVIANSASTMPPPGPVHTGTYAAAFSITTAAGTAWSRCYLNDGGLPAAAYYSAWFNILWNTTDSTGWSIMHWQRPLGTADGGAANLWDVMLVNEPGGTLSPAVMDYTRNIRTDGLQQTIVAGTWYHVEVFFLASDTDAGAFTMYVNDVPLVQLSGVSTDTTPSFGFHIGNYAQSLTSGQLSSPTGDPVYVDDITVATQYVLNDGGLAP